MESQYELIGLFATKVNDIMAEKTLADLAKANKFKVVEVDKWGIKQLAYPIKKETKAYYLRLVIDGGDAKGLANGLKLDETLLRHLLVRLAVKVEAKKPVKAKPARSATSTAVAGGKETK